MATLVNGSPAGHWDSSTFGNCPEHGKDFRACFDAEQRDLDALGDDVISFPYADGKAIYYVKSRKPLRLQHIPIGDAWSIPDYQIRGLRLADVDAMIERKRALARLFGKMGTVK